MKTRFFLCPLLTTLFFIGSCTKENNVTGVLQLKTINPVSETQKGLSVLKSTTTNPDLTGDTTVTVMTSLKLCFGDVWVSQGEVKAGNADNLEWFRITDATNRELKLFEEYVFPSAELPVGEYKSIKISMKNIFYRFLELESDASVKYELLETMGSSFDACNENDTTWVKPNYFSTDGNHKLNDDGVFELVSEGEKVAGFSIAEGGTAIVSWRLGAGVTEPCTNYLLDKNGNRQWDCGVDDMEIECPPSVMYMWDFLVEYQ